MRKITLKLEDLQVDSFETQAIGAASGTIHAMSPGLTTDCETDTCEPGSQPPVCDDTVNGSCHRTCYHLFDTCQPASGCMLCGDTAFCG
ncbi:MAG TPA: pinensin family lanthipeptide [Longimicrobiaceae bacterium]|jgi:hypothetical protein|nr:pinensin family lanthipeptide [Longimicrobiaceae bacterium]